MAFRPTHLSLFTGIGGLDLGLKIAIPTLRTICYVEREAFAAATLVARMEDAALDLAPIWDDISTFDGRRWRGKVVILSGGFPCQDLSVAGKRAGIDGERSGLWSEMFRVICEVRPQLVFIENVPGILGNSAARRVLGDLASGGFDAEWLSIQASDVGASHRRRRVFVLADTNGHRLEGYARGGFIWRQPGWHETPTRRYPGETGLSEFMADTKRERGRGRNARRTNAADVGQSSRHPGNKARAVGAWDAEPAVGRVANGIADRVDRLRALGNGVVPLQAAAAFSVLFDRL